MKIGLLTFHKALNCGAVLQSWALCHYLSQNGYEVGLIPNHVGEWARWDRLPTTGSFLGRMKMTISATLNNICSFGCRDLMIKRFKEFQRNYLPEVNASECDVISVGSDQVWRKSLTHDETGLFRGSDLPRDVRLISYAASYGDVPLSKNDLEELINQVKRFDCVSVREPLVKNQLESAGLPKVQLVVDPTLLLDAKEYDEISFNFDSLQEDFIFAYTVHATPFFVNTSKAIAKKLGLKLIMTSAAQNTRRKAPSGLTYGVSPDRMIGYIKKAKYVIASSFHGTVLSFIHQKPFISLRPDGFNAISRPVAFLINVGEEDRVVGPNDSNEKAVSKLTRPIKTDSLQRLSEMRAESMMWLDRAISGGVA